MEMNMVSEWQKPAGTNDPHFRRLKISILAQLGEAGTLGIGSISDLSGIWHQMSVRGHRNEIADINAPWCG